MSVDLPRNELGRFQSRPDSLYPKTIGLRVLRSQYPKFLALAESEGLRPTELARKAVEEYIEKHWNDQLNPVDFSE